MLMHDDVIKWKHFPRNWPFVRGIHRLPVNSPHKWPVTRSFDVFFDLRLNIQFSKQSWGWWFETPSRSLWRHFNDQHFRSCIPSHSIGLYFWGVDNSLIPGCLWLLAFILNNTLILGIWCSTIPHLPVCFCPWTFFQNIGFNMVPSDPFMSHLATLLGYSAGEFQALQLIVLATFGVVD